MPFLFYFSCFIFIFYSSFELIFVSIVGQLERYGAVTGRPSSVDPDERSASAERGRKRGRMMRDSADEEPSPGEYPTDGRCELTDLVLSRALVSSESDMQGETPEEQQQVVPRSRWQAVLLEAGGIGAAVSEESMRRLKYCLSWLQVSIEPVGYASRTPQSLTIRSITVCDNAYRRPNLDSPRLYCLTSTATRLATCT